MGLYDSSIHTLHVFPLVFCVDSGLRPQGNGGFRWTSSKQVFTTGRTQGNGGGERECPGKVRWQQEVDMVDLMGGK